MACMGGKARAPSKCARLGRAQEEQMLDALNP